MSHDISFVVVIVYECASPPVSTPTRTGTTYTHRTVASHGAMRAGVLMLLRGSSVLP